LAAGGSAPDPAKFISLLHFDKPNIVVITKSWLNDTYSDGMLVSLSEYNVYRVDRGSRGGGVCALVSTSLSSYIVPAPSRISEVEIVCFDVVSSNSNYRFITVYRPPEHNLLGREYMSLLTECLTYFCQPIILTGDFNLSIINWAKFISSHLFYLFVIHELYSY
jgi:hypothetical protein